MLAHATCQTTSRCRLLDQTCSEVNNDMSATDDSELPNDEENLPETSTEIDETQAMTNAPGSKSSSSALADTVLGDFRLLRPLGKGGMAEVWLAEQESLKRKVALKLLKPDLTEDETYVARFQTEAKAAAGLNHSNIVQVYTVGERGGQYFIAQEYVQGQTLKSFIQKKGALDVNLTLLIMRQVASALQAAGERGIVHRDIKPENIMLNRKGEAKVADFGLAQLQGGERLNLTQEGVTMGTPLYMSPEQVSGKSLDQRSDIYSFGISCYHMLAGRPPFDGENAVSVAVKHLHETPEPLEKIRDDIPIALCKVIQKMTAKKPEDRYENAQAVLNDVRKIAKSLKTGESVDHLISENVAGKTSFPVKRPAIVLPLMCVIVALLSAGMGLMLKQSVPPPNANALQTSISKASTPRDQYLKAMFEVDNEDAFHAVINYFPTDKVWTPRAHEQLALMYLADSSRHTEAREQFDILKKFEMPELRTKARLGEAYLAALNNDLTLAKNLLVRNSGDIQQYIDNSSSWKQLEEDTRRIIAEGEQGKPS